jgi:hypothetical protein
VFFGSVLAVERAPPGATGRASHATTGAGEGVLSLMVLEHYVRGFRRSTLRPASA